MYGKKSFCLGLSLLLALAGCGAGTSPASGTGKTPSPDPAAEEMPAEGMTEEEKEAEPVQVLEETSSPAEESTDPGSEPRTNPAEGMTSEADLVPEEEPEPFDRAEDPGESSFWEISPYTCDQVCSAALIFSYTDTYTARQAEVVSISAEGILEILLLDDEGQGEPEEYARYYVDGRDGFQGTDGEGDPVDLSGALESVWCDPGALSLTRAAAELLNAADPDLTEDALTVSPKTLTGQALSFYVYACLQQADPGPSFYDRESDEEGFYHVSEEEAEDLVRRTLGYVPEEGLEDLEGVFTAEEGGYRLMPAGFEDIRVSSRLIGQVPDEKGRTLLAEMRQAGSVSCQPCGIWEIRLEEDPESSYGWHLAGLVRRKDLPVFETLTASSSLKGHPAGNLMDGYRSTCWAEGADGPGLGTKIVLKASAPQKIHGIRIGAGYLKNDDLYQKNAAPDGYEILLSDGTKILAPARTWGLCPAPSPEYLEETPLWPGLLNGDDVWDHLYTDFISFGREFETDSVTIRLISVREGTRYEDTCLSEIRIY